MNERFLNKSLTCIVLLAIIGCAGPKVEPTPKAAQPHRGPDAVAAEALATYQLQRDGARTLTLMNTAVSQAPKRADLAYLHTRLCDLIEGCAPEALDARLRKLDPANAVVWMNALSTAQRNRDAAAEEQVLEAMSRSARFEIYWNPLVASIALARTQGTQGSNVALSDSIGWLAGTIVPELPSLTLACSKTRTANEQWAQRCRRLANLLMNSDTYLTESLGLTLALQVTTDPAARAKLEERARMRRYLWQESGEIVASQIEKDKFAAEQIQLIRTLPREQDVYLAIVRWAGRPTTPPAGFRME